MFSPLINRYKKFAGAGVFILLAALLIFLTQCRKDISENPVDDAELIEQLIQLDKGIIPVEDFFKTPEKTAFCISPDGNYISYLGSYQSRLNIYVQMVGSNEAPVRVTSETDRDIYNYFWKNNNTLLFIKDSGGDENFKLFAIDRVGSNKKDLTPFENVRIEIVDELRDFPDEVIIAMNRNNPALFEPYRLNIETGDMQQLAENRNMKNPVTIWKVDNKGLLRMAVSVEEGTKTHLLYRDTETDTFKTLIVSDWKDMVEPLFFHEDNQQIYALSNLNRDKTALVKINPENPGDAEIIFEHPHVDVMYAERSPRKHHLTTAYYATDKKHPVFFDNQLKNIHARLDSLFPSFDIYFYSFDDKGQNVIFRTYNDKTPGAFYFLNTDTNKILHLGNVNAKINADQTASMQYVSYKATDGLQIHGYLTLPSNGNKKKLPTVVLVHGGPMARDYWGYRADVQLLASRGYAVFQINFRGSWGYGKKFAVSGFKQWGRNMQRDITDGVNWLIEEGFADENNIAIYGASYGGFAALAGATFTPELYACAIDYVGPTNLFTLLENLPSYWEPEKQMMYEMIGNPKTDSLLLHAASPVFHVDRIKIPLFIAQGANDPRVNKNESLQMVEALRRRNLEVVYMLKEDEGHGFRLEENRLEFYKTMMGFLAKHLEATPRLSQDLDKK
jgi:dipeptidyl aminopeptidase/acylaminoacyl peptidase